MVKLLVSVPLALAALVSAAPDYNEAVAYARVHAPAGAGVAPPEVTVHAHVPGAPAAEYPPQSGGYPSQPGSNTPQSGSYQRIQRIHISGVSNSGGADGAGHPLPPSPQYQQQHQAPPLPVAQDSPAAQEQFSLKVEKYEKFLATKNWGALEPALVNEMPETEKPTALEQIPDSVYFKCIRSGRKLPLSEIKAEILDVCRQAEKYGISNSWSIDVNGRRANRAVRMPGGFWPFLGGGMKLPKGVGRWYAVPINFEGPKDNYYAYVNPGAGCAIAGVGQRRWHFDFRRKDFCPLHFDVTQAPKEKAPIAA